MDHKKLAWGACLGAILLVGLFLRMAYLQEIKSIPFTEHPVGDCRDYVLSASMIFAGDLVGNKVYFLSSPAYPYFLALCFSFFGYSLWMPLFVQALAGVAQALLLGLAARRLWGRAEGLLAAFLSAFYGPFLFFEGELLMVSLVCVLLSAAWFQLARSSLGIRQTFGAGALIALATLGSPSLLLSTLVLSAWLFLSFRTLPVSGARTLRIWGTLGLLAPSLLMVSLVTLRHWIVTKDFIPLTSSMGVNFFIGNHSGATGSFSVPVSLSGDLEKQSELLAEMESGRDLSPSQVSGFWFRKGLRFPLEAPGEFFILTLKKIILLLNSYEVPNVYDYGFYRRQSRILAMPLLQFSVLGPLGLAGLCLARVRKKAPFLPIFAVAYAVSILPFFITGRYRAPMLPVLILSASGFACDLVRRLKAKEWDQSLKRAGLLVVIAVAVILPGVPHVESSEMWLRLAQSQMEAGDLSSSQQAFEKALSENMENPRVWQGLGVLASLKGQPEEAIAALQKSLSLEPRSASVLMSLAAAQDALDRPEEARISLEKALELEPGNEDLLWSLWKLRMREHSPEDILALARKESEEKGVSSARLRAMASSLRDLGRYQEALDEIRKGIQAFPHEDTLRLDLARTYLDMGRDKESAAAADEVLALDPTCGDAHNILGVVAAQKGDIQEAIRQFSEACRLDPSNPNFKENLERARQLGAQSP